MRNRKHPKTDWATVRIPHRVKAMTAQVPRGPHLVCYRCDKLLEDASCTLCGGSDMVAPCRLNECKACREPAVTA